MSRALVVFLFLLGACANPDDSTGDTTCGGTAVVTLDDVASTNQGDTWTEDGVTLTLLPSENGDFNARFDEPTGCLWLYLDTRLLAEPSCPTTSAEVDGTDYCGNGGCWSVTAFDGNTVVDEKISTTPGLPETLVVTGAMDSIEVAGLETPICEIRLD